MHWLIEPPMDRWQLQTSGPRSAQRTHVVGCIAAHATRLGTGQPDLSAGGVIATGHQAWLWHPGILAKDIAMAHAAGRFDAGMFHLVVDQDVHPALRLELPVVRDGRLSVETIELAPTAQDVPTGCQPPADPKRIASTLADARDRLGASLAVDFAPLAGAFADPPPCQTLAQQITAALARLRQPILQAPIPVLFATDLPRLPAFPLLLDHILNDARACVRAYNTAADDRPGAGIKPLRVELDRVEAPLWALQWGQPRRRVFVDLAGHPPQFTLDNGEPIQHVPAGPGPPHSERQHTLAPRALLMTAMVRRWCCDLFIHGRGGDAYDRVTEDWWRRWRGESLSPMATVSADLVMDFNVPVSDELELRRALWHQHHLPHNIDREAPPGSLDTTLVEQKRSLLEHMHDDADPNRRGAAFKQTHQINRKLARSQPRLLARAQERVRRATVGLANDRIAAKRDWSFALYPPSKINEGVHFDQPEAKE